MQSAYMIVDGDTIALDSTMSLAAAPGNITLSMSELQRLRPTPGVQTTPAHVAQEPEGIPDPLLFALLWISIATFTLLIVTARTHKLVKESKESKEDKKAEEPLVRNAPEVIYLQTGGCEPGDDFNQLAGVTWAKHRIHITDIKYRRDATRK